GEAGQRRHNHIERVLRLSAIRSWIGQWLDHGSKKEDRAGPSMGEGNRQRARMFRSYVDEMNVETIDLSVELWETIQRFLTAPPVVTSAPVVDERAQLFEGDTFRPVV